MVFALASTDLYAILVAFTIAGFYIAFGFPVLAAAVCVLRGRWVRTPYDLGSFTKPTILAAAAWVIFETINIAWPRFAAAPWYIAWAVVLMVIVLGTVGAVVRMGLDRRIPMPDGAFDP
jgi:amino acid transporter